MIRRIENAIECWKRLLTEPREELNRWQGAGRFASDLGRSGYRQLRHDRAQQMAAALAFRTLFGLLPVLVVATVLVKALGMEQHYLEPLGRLFQSWGLDTVHIVPPPGMTPDESVTLGNWLRERVSEAEKVNLAAIGWVGVGITIYAAISLMVTIENSFNIIYRAPHGRSWANRIPVYWFVLTISPLLIVFSSYVNGRFQQLTAALHAQGVLSSLIGAAWGIFSIWVVMIAAYVLFPNTRVRLRPAAAGALVAALLLEIGKRTMGMYLQNALAVSQLYGSLGLIPLFMFWVYLMWLAVLFGLEVSSVLQHLHGRPLNEVRERPAEPALVDPAAVTLVMKRIAEGFEAGQPTSVEQISESTDVPPLLVERIIGQLVSAGLVHRLAESDTEVTLSRPPEAIPVARLLDVGFGMADRELRAKAAAGLFSRLRAAQQQVAANAHLGSLLDRTTP